MNIIFMGNPEFAVSSLFALEKSSHKICGVITNPPKRSGRGRKFHQTAVAKAANELGLSLLETDNLNSESTVDALTEFKSELFIVVAYKILPRKLISIPTFGAINLHGSLLPKYRGAAPIQWALIHGEKETGLSTFFIEPKVDTGKILMQKPVPIHGTDDFGSLSKIMSNLGSSLLVETIDKFENNELNALPQNHSKATAAPKITPDITGINWSKPAMDIHNLIRGLSPYPGAKTCFNGKILKIYKSEIQENTSGRPGVIINLKKDTFTIQTGKGSLCIYEVQIEGKKRMSSEHFLNGFQLKVGMELGN